MIDMYIMIWHLKILNLKTILRPSIVGGMPSKRTHVVPSLNIGCTPRACVAKAVGWTLEKANALTTVLKRLT